MITEDMKYRFIPPAPTQKGETSDVRGRSFITFRGGGGGGGGGFQKSVVYQNFTPPKDNYTVPPLAITILKKHPPPTPSRPSLFFHPLGIDYISYRIPVVGS